MKVLSPVKRRQAVEHVLGIFVYVSQRRACRVVGQARATQRRRPQIRSDEDALTGRIIELASADGRYGYRRITALLRREGWRVNHKRVERIWR